MFEVIIGFLVLALFLGAIVSVGQMVFGLIMWIIIGLFTLISWPLTWAYDKIKGNR